MSVPTWRRKENRKYNTLTKAIELAAHTIQCCENERIFPKRHRLSITADIIKEAKDIVKVINRANGRDLFEQYDERLMLQNQALDLLNDLEMDLNIAFATLHPNITENKIDSWCKLIDETRTLLKNTIKANFEKHKQELEEMELSTEKDNS